MSDPTKPTRPALRRVSGGRGDVCACGHRRSGHLTGGSRGLGGACRRMSGQIDERGRGLPCDCTEFTPKTKPAAIAKATGGES